MPFVLVSPVVSRGNTSSFLAPSQSNHFVAEVIINDTVASRGPVAVS